MGFIKAFAGSVGGMLADQWLDFLTVPSNLPPTAAFFPAIAKGSNAGRGSNIRGSENIISNGSRIIVPEGYGAITMIDGQFTGLVTEPGGFEFRADDQNAQSLFIDGLISPTIKMSWERFKFGGQPANQHLIFFVNLKEIPNNRFGTQSEIYWDDAYLNAQVGAVTRGTYTLRIVDPLLFVKGLLPVTFYSPNAPIFDFSDLDNPVSEQLFNEVVSSLAPAFSKYCNDPNKGNRIARLQSDSLGFAQSLSAAVEEGYQWSSARGLKIENVALTAIEYDADTRALLSDVKKADALSGARGNSFMQQAAARGVQAAGENGGGAGLAMFGMGAGGIGLAGLQQPVNPGMPSAAAPVSPGIPVPPAATTEPPTTTGAPAAPIGQTVPTTPVASPPAIPNPTDTPATDPFAKLSEWKRMLDAGLITPADFEAAKNKLLGL